MGILKINNEALFEEFGMKSIILETHNNYYDKHIYKKVIPNEPLYKKIIYTMNSNQLIQDKSSCKKLRIVSHSTNETVLEQEFLQGFVDHDKKEVTLSKTTLTIKLNWSKMVFSFQIDNKDSFLNNNRTRNSIFMFRNVKPICLELLKVASKKQEEKLMDFIRIVKILECKNSINEILQTLNFTKSDFLDSCESIEPHITFNKIHWKEEYESNEIYQLCGISVKELVCLFFNSLSNGNTKIHNNFHEKIKTNNAGKNFEPLFDMFFENKQIIKRMHFIPDNFLSIMDYDQQSLELLFGIMFEYRYPLSTKKLRSLHKASKENFFLYLDILERYFSMYGASDFIEQMVWENRYKLLSEDDFKINVRSYLEDNSKKMLEDRLSNPKLSPSDSEKIEYLYDFLDIDPMLGLEAFTTPYKLKDEFKKELNKKLAK